MSEGLNEGLNSPLRHVMTTIPWLHDSAEPSRAADAARGAISPLVTGGFSRSWATLESVWTDAYAASTARVQGDRYA
jgi:hypothetical protein